MKNSIAGNKANFELFLTYLSRLKWIPELAGTHLRRDSLITQIFKKNHKQFARIKYNLRNFFQKATCDNRKYR